ncbi:MAG: toll/interleukin-1 receptor domain-containing protein [Pyrinomonadaceae bacterium]
MYELPNKIEPCLRALSKLCETNSEHELQEIVVNAQVRVKEEWSHDNWNGGTTGHAVYLTVPEDLFLRSVTSKDEIQTSVRDRLNQLHNVQNEFVECVFLEFEAEEDDDGRTNSGLLLKPVRVVSEKAEHRIWEKDCFRLFLSHKSASKTETYKLKEELRELGITCFVAHADIHPTKEWVNEILNALTTMDGFAALMTDDFHDSDWTDQEVGFALARNIPTIAVMLGKEPYGFLGRFQGLRSSWNTLAWDIVGVSVQHERMFRPYLKKLEKCSSFHEANALGSLLDKIVALDERQIDELIDTYNGNYELRGAYAFNGAKSDPYGPGIVHHLNRLSRRTFKLNKEGSTVHAVESQLTISQGR